MSPNIQPIDFKGEHPPVRIIGSECEYLLRETPAAIDRKQDTVVMNTLHKYLANGLINQQQLVCNGGYLSNGGRVYIDSNLLEYATAESYGARQAAAADMAGMRLVRTLVDGSGINHNGLYRLSGFTLPGVGDVHITQGAHENYLIPRDLTDEKLLYEFIPSFLAARVWSWAGSVMTDGYHLSQKAEGIGGTALSFDYRRRLTEGDKPMAIIPNETTDEVFVRGSKWSRLEVRLSDPIQAPRTRFLGFAATSLVLRLIEHSSFVEKYYERLALKDPVTAAHLFSGDLTLKSTTTTLGGMEVTAADINEMFVEATELVMRSVALPEEEVFALEQWKEAIDILRRTNLEADEYAEAADHFDFAARYALLRKQYPDVPLSSHHREAAHTSLSWDRISPKGYAQAWWNKRQASFFSHEEVDGLVYGAPRKTRARRRAIAIRSGAKKRTPIVNWSVIQDKRGDIPLDNPYA